MSNNHAENIHISIDKEIVSTFFWFLEKGVKKEIFVGSSIRELLSEQLNVSMDYIDNRIKTLFLNYNPVGDINKTIVNDGAILALSTAMPGLAGATFRRMESSEPSLNKIDDKKNLEQEKGIIVLKFFNMVLEELGPALLESGVLIPKDELVRFFTEHSGAITAACNKLEMNNKNTTIQEVCKMDIIEEDKLINLYVFSV